MMTNQEHRTRFNASESQSGNRIDDSERHQRLYNRLAMHNDSTRNGMWRDEDQATTQDHDYLLDSIAASLSLTKFQRQRAQHIVDQLPEDFFRAYKNVSVLLAVCAIVGHEDGRPYHPSRVFYHAEHPHFDRHASSEEFVAFCDEHSVEKRELRSLYGRIRAAVEL